MALELQQSELGRMLGRGPWEDNVDGFVEELVSLLPALFKELPVAKVEARATDENPSPIKIEDATTDGQVPVFTVTRGDEVFTVTLNPETGELSGQSPPDEQPPVSSSYPGQVVSGTGATYSVQVYPEGLSNPSVVVSVAQLQIDAAETIPAGTWTMVTSLSDGTFVMQVPVWL